MYDIILCNLIMIYTVHKSFVRRQQKGMLMSNMKALIVTNQKIWPMQKFLQTNKQTNGRAKNYMCMIYQYGGI